MARSRNIKPGFFKNEALSDCSPLARLLFAGLWCLADREGRLEDRPKRIRVEVLPYDDGSVDDMLNELQRAGFILRYEADGQRFIQVLNFSKHQNPHHREPASLIPAPGESQASPGPDQGKPGTCLSTAVRIPDSLNLIPDSLSTDTQGDARVPGVNKDEPSGFSECWSSYPKRGGGNSRAEALKAYRARLKAGVLHADLLAGVKRYAAYIRGTGKEGTAYVKQAATFFGTGEHWREAWALPTDAPGCAPAVAPASASNVFAGAV
jgi:hypothetical protein